MHWWITQGYFSFDAGNDGFPVPGQVVRWYRKRKGWAQRDLSVALNISEQAVRDIELRNEGMESISRRRALAELLAIPPILLGISALPSSTGPEEPQKRNTTQGNLDTKHYQEKLTAARSTHHHAGPGYDIASTQTIVTTGLAHLYQALPHTSQKRDIIELLISYHRFTANLWTDSQHHTLAIEHQGKAYTLAKDLGDHQLQTLILYCRGLTRQELAELQPSKRLTILKEAQADFDEASTLTKKTPLSLQASLALSSAGILANFASTQADKMQVLRMVNGAEKVSRQSLTEGDPLYLRLTWDKFHLMKGEALALMGWNQDAITSYGEVNCAPDQTRRRTYNAILMARSYAERGSYEIATDILTDVLPTAKAIGSSVNVARVQQAYTSMTQTKYKDTPELARLGLMLKS